MIMKRLIVISVVFALVAGTAFADVNVGGAVFGKVNVLEGTSEKFVDPNNAKTPPTAADKDAVNSDSIRTSGSMTRLRLDASGQSDDGTFGGYVRFEAGGDGGSTTGWGNVWWKPIDQVKFLVGSAGYDGFWAKDGVTRWGFYRDAGDVGIIPEGWAFGASFYDGFTKGGMLTITPLEALEINIGIPFFDGSSANRAEEIYKKTHAQVAYNIDGIGDLAVTYVGSYQGDNNGPTATANLIRNNKVKFAQPTTLPAAIDVTSSGYDANIKNKFYAFFNLSAVENLGLQIGLGFTVPAKQEDVEEGEMMPGVKYKATSTLTYNTPVAIGLGASYDAGAFGIKARVQAEVGHSASGTFKTEVTGSPTETDEFEVKGPVVLTFDLLPSFAINDSMKVFLSVGVSSVGKYNVLNIVDNPAHPSNGGTDPNAKGYLKQESEKDSSASWHVHPYFTKSVGWCQSFYAGFRMWGNNRDQYVASVNDKGEPTEKPIINWQVPIGVAFQF
jgi:hypothetical protein